MNILLSVGGDSIVFCRKKDKKEGGRGGEEGKEEWKGEEGRKGVGKERSGYLLHEVLHKTFRSAFGSRSPARLLEPHPFHQCFKQNQSSGGRK